MKDKQELLLSLAESAITYGAKKTDQIEILIQDNYEIGCEINLGQINKATKSQDAGASIRVVIGKRLGSAYTNRLDQARICKASYCCS